MNTKTQVGQITSSSHIVLANYDNRSILAQSMSPESPEPYVIWSLSEDGDPHSGSYFVDKEAAEKYFAYSCFDWIPEKTCIPQCFQGNFNETYTDISENPLTMALMQERFEKELKWHPHEESSASVAPRQPNCIRLEHCGSSTQLYINDVAVPYIRAFTLSRENIERFQLDLTLSIPPTEFITVVPSANVQTKLGDLSPKPINESSKMPDFSEVTTKHLVEELSHREGVRKEMVDPYCDLTTTISGPAIVLTVTD